MGEKPAAIGWMIRCILRHHRSTGPMCQAICIEVYGLRGGVVGCGRERAEGLRDLRVFEV